MTHVSGAVALGPGEGDAIWFLSNRITIKATAAATDGAYALFEAYLPPGFSPPLHIHHREEEAFWILEGQFTIRCGDELISAGPGAYVSTPRGVPHTFVVEGTTPGRLLTLLTPGGSEGFFAEMGRPAGGDGFPPPGPVDLDRLSTIAGRFGIDLVGPPMTARSTAR